MPDLFPLITKTYQLVWAERSYLLKLALPAFLIKLVCISLALSLAGGEGHIRFSLFLIPGWLVEGWMLSHFVRLVAFNQRWPFQPSGNMNKDEPVLYERYRGVMGGLIGYTLIQMAIAGSIALMMGVLPVSWEELSQRPLTANDVTPAVGILSFVMLGVWFYAFRFLWLYVPLAMGQPLLPYLSLLKGGAMVSVRFLALWFLCALPVLMIAQLIGALILGPFIVDGSAGDAVMFGRALLMVIIDLIKNLLCAGAVVYFLQGMMKR